MGMKPRMTARRREEAALITRLQTEFGYRLFNPGRKKDRHEIIYNLKTGKVVGNFRMFRLAAPPGSVLAVAMADLEEEP